MFVGAFVDQATGEKQDYLLTQVYTMLSKFERWLRRKHWKDIVSDELLGKR